MLFVIGIIILPILIGIVIHNSLVRKRNAVENAFGTMDVQLKQRYDLIPNLIATVQEYAKHERGIMSDITKLRTMADNKGSLSNEEKVQLDNQLSKTMSGIMVAVENYPDLKANQNFIQLQRSLNETEAQISAARRTYNATITDFNNAIETFPNSIIAGMMNLTRKEVFVIPDVERQNVDVKKLFNS